MSGNYRGYNDYCSCEGDYRDNYREYHKEEKREEKKEKKEDCKCRCVDTLACELKEYKCRYIIAFEKNAFIVGRVKAVKNNAVLVLEEGFKVVDDLGIFGFDKIFISICKVVEFIPIQNGLADTVLSNLKESGRTQLL